jgi:hypothetical protein
MFAIARYLACIAWYHLLHTLVVRWQGAISGEILMLSKEGIWFVLVGICVVSGRKVLWHMRKQLLLPVVLVACLCFWAFGMSWWHEIPLWQQLIGFKYDLLPILILLSAVVVGIVTYPAQAKQEMRWRRFVYLIAFLLVGWLVWQIGKVMLPEFYARWWYGAVGDFVQGTAPPLYYRTWPGGSMRLQGLFAWPNNYGFWLVGIASFWLVSLGFAKHRKLLAWWSSIFFVSLLRTLSRGAWIGVFVQIVFLAYVTWSSRLRRMVAWWGGVFVLGIALLSLLKQGSSLAHIEAFWSAITTIAQQPFGYGLGMSWPAVHFGGAFLPENHYFQLLMDLGIPGLLLWCMSLVVLVRPGIQVLRQASISRQCISAPLALLLLGVCWLLLEGMFLHVFEDSMVTYLFLVPLWIALWREMKK